MKQFLEKPLVSVIIPTYNRGNLIGQTLDTVLGQSYQNLEIIIVDDGSTDNTEEVIKAIQDSRVRYINYQPNRGGSTARNIGIKNATGEYIAFLDSDDLWKLNKIDLQLASIFSCSNPRKVVSYTQFIVNQGNAEQKIILPNRGKIKTETLADYLFCSRGQMQTSTLMLHRSLASEIFFRQDLKKHQDWDFCLRLEANGAIFSFLDKPLTIWNATPRKDRVSKISNYHISLNWICDYQSSISAKAKTSFLLIEVLPKLIEKKERKLYAEKIILDGFLHKIITLKDFVQTTKKIWNLNNPYKKILTRLLLPFFTK
ncbi:MAG: glycosyltransferase family 2 protein [Xenococcaceae cyanobacterium MO_188.B32]|nr:glycosyltransferase family 2 protein [Xenococcaceae cyanobacterium MO_188.B32]